MIEFEHRLAEGVDVGIQQERAKGRGGELVRGCGGVIQDAISFTERGRIISFNVH